MFAPKRAPRSPQGQCRAKIMRLHARPNVDFKRVSDLLNAVEGAIDYSNALRGIGAHYDHLLMLTGSPVGILNRAVARAKTDGPGAALADLAPLETDKRLQSYQPFWAAKGHLLLCVGDTGAAAEALTIAIGLTTEESVKDYLKARLASRCTS